jgi:hypothetical protein
MVTNIRYRNSGISINIGGNNINFNIAPNIFVKNKYK